MYFKENLIYLRKISNLTQDSLAISLNVKRYNVADWEQGRAEPSFKMLSKICSFFDVKIDMMINQKLEIIKKDDLLYCESIIRTHLILA